MDGKDEIEESKQLVQVVQERPPHTSRSDSRVNGMELTNMQDHFEAIMNNE